MESPAFLAELIGVEHPWQVRGIHLSASDYQVQIVVERCHDRDLSCARCGQPALPVAAQQRQWRHLDMLQYQTVILATDLPRVSCATHGVQPAKVPWAGADSRYTYLFEALMTGSMSAFSRIPSCGRRPVAGPESRCPTTEFSCAAQL